MYFVYSPCFSLQFFGFGIAGQDKRQTIGDDNQTGLGGRLSGIGDDDLRIGHFGKFCKYCIGRKVKTDEYVVRTWTLVVRERKCESMRIFAIGDAPNDRVGNSGRDLCALCRVANN